MKSNSLKIITAALLAATLATSVYACGGGYGGGSGSGGVYQTPMPHPSPKPTM
ncbi:MAG TPA: hypothetical protein VID24_00415 [Candidatus Eremiobacteraceae bacterium]